MKEQNEMEEGLQDEPIDKSSFFVKFTKIMLSGALFPASVSAISAVMLFTLISGGEDYVLQIGKKDTYQAPFFAYLEKGVQNKTFNSDYFETAFSYYDRKSNGQLSSYGKTESLEDFIIFLNSSEKAKDLQGEPLNKVNVLLASSKQTEPFALLPSEERRLMEQLQLQTLQYDDEMAIRTMTELKQVLLARHKEYQKIEAQNAWSLPLSIVGVFLTLVFGIWSTILSVKQSNDKSRHFKVSAGKARPAF